MEKRYSIMSSSPPTPASPTPTTFVQADANTFRELVQKLTGAAGDSPEKLPVTLPARLASKPITPTDATGPRRSPFKLQERRHTMRKLEIKLGLTSIRNSPSHFSPRQTHRLDSPIPSPVTPLGSESLFSGRVTSSGSESPASEEDKAIAEKGFYLHPSPLSTPRGSDPPELLTLFPLSSPSQQRRD
ncbi:hypothetical protein L1049_018645 [Liquidambar formosana]|uniref:VQ domain-containing protein n=1 Tax=Liquidambar formosana TaxID=63359 RepID=A0AAP0WMI5_LIQFO